MGPIHTWKKEQIMKKKAGKPEESKTLRQWALLGRVPKEGTLPSYLWTERNEEGKDFIRTVYYHADNTREMTAEEKERFMADSKAFVKKYADMFYLID